MELAATSYPVAIQPPARRQPQQTAQLGQDGESRWRVWARRAAPVVLLGVIAAVAADAAYQARHSPRDLALVITNYYLIGLLACCVWKLHLMSSPFEVDPAIAAAWEPERRRTKSALFVVSVALVIVSALRLADTMPSLALKLAVWWVAAAGTAIGIYFIFRRRDGPRRRPDELSSEQPV